MARPPARRALLIDAMGTLIELLPPAPILRRELRDRLGIEISLGQAERGARGRDRLLPRAHARGPGCGDRRGLHARCARVLGAALPPAAGADPAALTEVLLASLRFAAHR